MAAFLGSAEWTFVTQDSVTMVTEAIAAGRPTTVLYPTNVSFGNQSFLPAYLARLEARHRIVRVPMASVASRQYANEKLTTVQSSINAQLCAELLTRLGWRRAG